MLGVPWDVVAKVNDRILKALDGVGEIAIEDKPPACVELVGDARDDRVELCRDGMQLGQCGFIIISGSQSGRREVVRPVATSLGAWI